MTEEFDEESVFGNLTCPKCGDGLIELSDVYEYYPSNIKYVRWIQCPTCGWECVIDEQDF